MMRPAFPDVVEKGRIMHPRYATRHGDTFGAFVLKCPISGSNLKVVASDGKDWHEVGFPPPVFEHVSVSLPDRCATWSEMCWIKGLFWEPEELVIQYHPPASEYVNNHQFCLHLWKPVGVDIPLPPSATVGLKGVRLC